MRSRVYSGFGLEEIAVIMYICRCSLQSCFHLLASGRRITSRPVLALPVFLSRCSEPSVHETSAISNAQSYRSRIDSGVHGSGQHNDQHIAPSIIMQKSMYQSDSGLAVEVYCIF